MKTYFVYILKCSDDTYYVGFTSNLAVRLTQHETGFYKNSYTSSRRPVDLVFYVEFSDPLVGISYEKKIKKWSQAKKEALIAGNHDALIALSKKIFRKS
jgi:putative endonuclease